MILRLNILYNHLFTKLSSEPKRVSSDRRRSHFVIQNSQIAIEGILNRHRLSKDRR